MRSDKEDRMTESLMLRSVASHDVQVFLGCPGSLDSNNFFLHAALAQLFRTFTA